jgi:lauroyl/myristoyl acyltransferase
LGALVGRRIVAPTGTQFHPFVSGWVKRAKRTRGIVSSSPQRGLRALVRALERGDLVALPLDGGSYRRGAVVRLGAGNARLATGAARLAVLSGRPVLPVFSRRVAFMEQEVEVHPALRPPTRGARLAASAFTQRLADLLAAHLRTALGQWCIFRPLATAREAGAAGSSAAHAALDWGGAFDLD